MERLDNWGLFGDGAAGDDEDCAFGTKLYNQAIMNVKFYADDGHCTYLKATRICTRPLV